jgi:hypothetical protein
MKKKFQLYWRWSASSRALPVLIRLLFENIPSKMHLARWGGKAEAGGGGEGVGWTDRWQGTHNYGVRQLIMWKWHLADRPRGQGEWVTIRT